MTDLTYESLARHVRTVAAEAQVTLRTSKSNIHYWVGGAPPNPQAAHFLREALSRRIGKRLTLDDIGLSTRQEDSEPADTGLTVEGDPVETLGQLGSADIERRTLLTASAYSVAAAALPLGAAEETLARTRRALAGGAAGDEEVRAVRDMAAMFTAIDERHGGQHGRSAVVQYLITDVADLCRARFRTTDHRNDMLCAAASLTYLAGWKAYDAGEMGLAQRYYLQAYALTQEAHDQAHQAFTLRILAHHGMDNQRYEHVLDLADAALHRARGAVPPATEALFVICRARALAGTGQCAQALTEADRAWDLAQAPAQESVGWDAMWGNASATVDSHTAKILEQVGDHQGAERRYAHARRQYANTEHRRIAALSAAAEGHAQARQGQIEAACATWRRSLQTMTGIRSTRTVTAVYGMRSALVPAKARGSRTAGEFDAEARHWLREAS
ncbi:hypothetical protein ACWEV4_32680 [Streptomyces sp. NPDC003860]